MDKLRNYGFPNFNFLIFALKFFKRKCHISVNGNRFGGINLLRIPVRKRRQKTSFAALKYPIPAVRA
jgi:hypothetical protein